MIAISARWLLKNKGLQCKRRHWPFSPVTHRARLCALEAQHFCPRNGLACPAALRSPRPCIRIKHLKTLAISHGAYQKNPCMARCDPVTCHGRLTPAEQGDDERCSSVSGRCLRCSLPSLPPLGLHQRRSRCQVVRRHQRHGGLRCLQAASAFPPSNTRPTRSLSALVVGTSIFSRMAPSAAESRMLKLVCVIECKRGSVVATEMDAQCCWQDTLVVASTWSWPRALCSPQASQ